MRNLREIAVREYNRMYRQQLRSVEYFGERDNRPLRRYQRELEQEISLDYLFSSREQLYHDIRRRDVIYIGDFHPSRASKLEFRDLLAEGRDPTRPSIIAMEDFYPYEDQKVQQYLDGKIDAETLFKKIGRKKLPGSSSQRGIKEILRYARDNKISVKGINGRSSLNKKDHFFASKIGDLAQQNPSAQIFVLAGNYHVARCHLPQKVTSYLGREINDLIILQDDEKIFFDLQKKGLEHEYVILSLNSSTYAINNLCPILKALIYENVNEPPQERDSSTEILQEYVHIIQEILIKAFDLPSRKIKPPKVFSYHEKDLEQRVRSYAGEGSSEKFVSELLANKEQGNSATFGNNVIYLHNQSMDDIAEEVTHCLHNLVSGSAPIERTAVDNFYFAILGEMLGYLGSKLFVPHRKPLVFADVKDACANEQEYDKVSRFILAHRALERKGKLNTDMQELAHEMMDPEGPNSYTLIHYFGYTLGEKVFKLMEQQKLPPQIFLSLFYKKYEQESEAFREYILLTQIASSVK